MAAHPLKSRKQNIGELGLPVKFGGVEFREGDYLYADVDGLITAAEALEL